MSPNKKTKKLKTTNEFSLKNSSFLTIFFYVSPHQNIETLIHFFQKNHFLFGNIKKIKIGNFLYNTIKNANFVAQTCQPVSEIDFNLCSQFLKNNVILVAFLYKNKILNVPRLFTIRTVSVLSGAVERTAPSSLYVFENKLQKLTF